MRQLILGFIFFVLAARDPFFLSTPAKKVSAYILKGTIIDRVPIACIQYDGQLYNMVEVNDVIGDCTVVAIACGLVHLKHADGRIEIVRLDEDDKAGGC